jgi:septal ring factor EnvC (AmiA/AmiB activator)
MRWAGAALVLALAQPLAGAAPGTRSEVKQQLDSTRQAKRQLELKLKKGRQDLNRHVKVEKDILGQLRDLNREVETAKRDAQVHVRNLGLVEDRLAALKERQGQASQQEQADRQALRVQLRAVQRSRARQGAALLFGARTPAQLAARSSALRELSLSTRRDVLGLRQRLDQLEAYKTEYSHREVELVQQRSQAEAARKRALNEAARKQARLKDVRNKKDQAKQVVAGLEQAAGRMQDLMESLLKESQRLAKTRNDRGVGLRKMHQTTGGPSTLRGRAPWPVQGRVLSRFGRQRHPVFNVPVFNRNIEIAAPFGGPIKAIAAGVVEYVGEMQDFGKLVVIDHGGGLKSVYGYASAASVTKDQAVAQGDVIGEIGEHGASGQPSLYFQISQNARPQDPMRYLSRR